MIFDLYCGDCLEEMNKIEDGSVDAIITDLPYGATICKWDAVIHFEPMWKQLERIIKKNGVIVLFGSQPFTSTLIMSNIKMFRYEWIWDKHISRGMHQAKYQPMRKHENILVFSKKYPFNYYPQMIKRNKPIIIKNYKKENGTVGNYKDNSKSYTYTHKYPNTIIIDKWEANKGKFHPTQKPVALMEYLIKTYTNEGETILDFTMGTGTTGVACKLLNRNFIGIENDKKYFKIAENRIKKANSLFVK